MATKCVGDDNKMLMTVLTILVTKIHYLFTIAYAANIHKSLVFAAILTHMGKLSGHDSGDFPETFSKIYDF